MILFYICVSPFTLMPTGTYYLSYCCTQTFQDWKHPLKSFLVVIYCCLHTPHTTIWKFRWRFSSVLQWMWSILVAHIFVKHYHGRLKNVYEKLSSIIRRHCQGNGALFDTLLERRSAVTSSCLFCWSAVKVKIGGRKDSSLHSSICYFKI
jgi:hypothetical protein